LTSPWWALAAVPVAPLPAVLAGDPGDPFAWPAGTARGTGVDSDRGGRGVREARGGPGLCGFPRTRCCTGWWRWRTRRRPAPAISSTTCRARRGHGTNSLPCSAPSRLGRGAKKKRSTAGPVRPLGLGRAALERGQAMEWDVCRFTTEAGEVRGEAPASPGAA